MMMEHKVNAAFHLSLFQLKNKKKIMKTEDF